MEDSSHTPPRRTRRKRRALATHTGCRFDPTPMRIIAATFLTQTYPNSQESTVITLYCPACGFVEDII